MRSWVPQQDGRGARALPPRNILPDRLHVLFVNFNMRTVQTDSNKKNPLPVLLSTINTAIRTQNKIVFKRPRYFLVKYLRDCNRTALLMK